MSHFLIYCDKMYLLNFIFGHIIHIISAVYYILLTIKSEDFK